MQGERVRLRPMTRHDLEGDVSWSRMEPEMLRRRFARAERDPTQGLFVVLNEDGERIGRAEYVAYRAEERRARCNLHLAERFTGRGYGTDALRTFTRCLFETLDVDWIGCLVHTENLRSVRMCRKCGFRIERTEKGLYVMTLARPRRAGVLSG